MRPGSVVLDIGANIGYFTLLAAVLAGDKGMVLAVEPDPHNFSLLERNIASNQKQTVALYPCALGAQAGAADLYRSPDQNFGDHRLYNSSGGDSDTRMEGVVEVPVRTGDELVTSATSAPIDFIKMDVQGYECYVLRGLKKTIVSSAQLILLSEVWPMGLQNAGSSVAEFVDLCSQTGMLPYALLSDGQLQQTTWSAVTDFAEDVMQECPDEGYFNIVAMKGHPSQI